MNTVPDRFVIRYARSAVGAALAVWSMLPRLRPGDGLAIGVIGLL